MAINILDKEWFENIQVNPADLVKLDFAVTLERAIERAGLNRTELAKLIESSPSWITKVMRGDANVTIETMCALAAALEHDVHIHLAPKNAAVRWFEVHTRLAPQPANEDKITRFWQTMKEDVHVRTTAAA